MATTLLVTRNVPDRVRGFLASCMAEVAPGVYVSPRMAQAVRLRVWAVLEKWGVGARDDSAVLVWVDRTLPTGMGVAALGTPPRELHSIHGVVLARRALSEDELGSLITEVEPLPF